MVQVSAFDHDDDCEIICLDVRKKHVRSIIPASLDQRPPLARFCNLAVHLFVPYLRSILALPYLPPIMSSRGSSGRDRYPAAGMSSSSTGSRRSYQQSQQRDRVSSSGGGSRGGVGASLPQQQAMQRMSGDYDSIERARNGNVDPRQMQQRQYHASAGRAGAGVGSGAAATAGVPPPPPPPPPPPQQPPPQQQVIHAVPSNVSANTSMLSTTTPAQAISVESPLPPMVQRSLGDRSYDKRKNAALEIESLVKSLQESGNSAMVHSVLLVLSKDFCTSMNANYRKGGLIGIAATAIGLMANTRHYLDAMLPPVLQCFDDPESRVRYYACESLYNIAKVARTAILRYFNDIFDGLTKLFADVDIDVKNGASLLDRLIKDIVTESDTFQVEQFLPLLQNYIRRTNPYIRQLLVSWITVLDSVPDINMIDYLPDFLDGLFNMLSDSNREIRQAADSALSEFLREVRTSTVVEFGPIVSILVSQCHSRDPLNRLTAMTWLAELIHHPHSGGDALLPYHAEVLAAIMSCLSDTEAEIRTVSERTNADLLTLVRDTEGGFEVRPLLDTLTKELLGKDDVPTKMAALRWINMLLEKRKDDMKVFIPDLLPVLLRTLSDPSDPVVILTLQVLSRISLADQKGKGRASLLGLSSSSSSKKSTLEKARQLRARQKGERASLESALLADIPGVPPPDDQFQMVLNAILGLFASDRRLLETRGSLVVRKLCVLLNAESVYIRLAGALSSVEFALSGEGDNATIVGTTVGDQGPEASNYSLEFVGTMVQTLNLILLTAPELHGLRSLLSKSFAKKSAASGQESKLADDDAVDGARVFTALFHCWCHNPVATFSLCLLAQAYDVAFALVKKFSELEVTVGFLMQIDKLVQLLESPIFIHLRLQLLDVEKPQHPYLLKSCYGLLMLVPQSDAFRSLNDRLATVCNLRDNLGVSQTITSNEPMTLSTSQWAPATKHLLERFNEVAELHRIEMERAREKAEMEVQPPSIEVPNHDGMAPPLTPSGVSLAPSTPGGKSVYIPGGSVVGVKGLAQPHLGPPPPPSPSSRPGFLPQTGPKAIRPSGRVTAEM